VARPLPLQADMVNSRFSPVKNHPARRIPLLAVIVTSLLCNLFFASGDPMRAQPQTLEETVERIAQKAAALPHEHRMSLIWTNHSALSEQRSEHLRTVFTAQIGSPQLRLVQGETVPALRVMIEQTPTKIVFVASVPAEGRASVVMEEVARAQAVSDVKSASVVRLEKVLLWQQEEKLLSAAFSGDSAGAEKQMVLLTDDALQIYRDEEGSWKLQATKALPGPHQTQRGARGQLVFAEDNFKQAGILLPGRRCEVNLTDDSAVACTAVSTDWPSGHLLALPACGAQTWWLKSDSTDWTAEDRVLLRNAGAGRESAPVAEMSVPGPVQAIGAGPNAASASVVVRNLSTGNYEVYRFGLSCAN
jgi:hypothetical protein